MFRHLCLRFCGSNSVGGSTLPNYLIVHIANFSPACVLTRALNRTAEKLGCVKEGLERCESVWNNVVFLQAVPVGQLQDVLKVWHSLRLWQTLTFLIHAALVDTFKFCALVRKVHFLQPACSLWKAAPSKENINGWGEV